MFFIPKFYTSSGIEFVNTPRCIATEPPAKRDCQCGHCGLCQREPKVPGLYKKHTVTQPVTQPVMHEMRLEPLNVCLTDRRLNQMSLRDSPNGVWQILSTLGLLTSEGKSCFRRINLLITTLKE